MVWIIYQVELIVCFVTFIIQLLLQTYLSQFNCFTWQWTMILLIKSGCHFISLPCLYVQCTSLSIIPLTIFMQLWVFMLENLHPRVRIWQRYILFCFTKLLQNAQILCACWAWNTFYGNYMAFGFNHNTSISWVVSCIITELLQSNQVKRTPQDSISELIIWKMNPLVVPVTGVKFKAAFLHA